jgi:hypothetical protein
MTQQQDQPVPTTEPPTGREPALNRLVVAMLVNLGIGLVIAVATFLGHDQIVAAQLAAAHPAPDAVASTRDSLSATLWSRPAPAIAVALLYPLFIRRLRRHQRRGYRRVVIVGGLQLVALIWYAVGAGYPEWLRIAQVVQAVAVLAVLVLATRPAVRVLFGYQPPTALVRSGRWAAATLFVLAPLIAELAWGSTRASQIAGLLLFLPVYGAGALLIRELVRRTGRGWVAVLVLGVGYGLVEEGISLQSLTSTTIYPSMSGLAPQLGGVNVSYTVMVLAYHAVFSIGIPIALAELTRPAVRTTPWLRTPGLVITGVVALLGFGLIRLIPLTADPHYLMPWPVDVVFAVLVAALAVYALRGAPRPAAPTEARVPAPLVVAGLSLLATVVFLGLMMPLPGAEHAGYAPTAGTAWVAVVAGLVVAVVTAVVARRWTASTAWTDRHTVAALTTALLGHTVIGLLSLVHTPLDRIVLAALGVVEVVLLLRLAGAVRGRADQRRLADLVVSPRSG